MRIGLCSSDLTPMPSDELFTKIKNLGFASTQLAFSSISEMDFVPDGRIEIPEDIPEEVIKKIKDSSKKYGVDIEACNGTFNMAHPEKAVREEALRCFENFSCAVNKLGVKIITLCSGTRNREDLWAYHPDNCTEEAWSDMIDTMKKAIQIAEKYSIVLAPETEAANIIDTPEKAKKMMEEVGSPNLKMIMDCANLFHAGKAKRENVREIVEHAFEIFGKDVVIAHGKDIKESDGIEFCGTGQGIIDYKQFVELLIKYGYRGDMLLHGIFEDDKMRLGLETIEKCL